MTLKHPINILQLTVIQPHETEICISTDILKLTVCNRLRRCSQHAVFCKIGSELFSWYCSSASVNSYLRQHHWHLSSMGNSNHCIFYRFVFMFFTMCITPQAWQTTVWVRNKPPKDPSHRKIYQVFSFVSHTSWAKEKHHTGNSNQQHLLRKGTISMLKRTGQRKVKSEKVTLDQHGPQTGPWS